MRKAIGSGLEALLGDAAEMRSAVSEVLDVLFAPRLTEAAPSDRPAAPTTRS